MDPLTIIDTRKIAQSAEGNYINLPLSMINDHVVRISIMSEPYYWHYHPNSDETFLVTEGVLLIDLEDTTVALLTGQLYTVPKNTIHRTRPGSARSVNLTFELEDMETVEIGEL